MRRTVRIGPKHTLVIRGASNSHTYAPRNTPTRPQLPHVDLY